MPRSLEAIKAHLRMVIANQSVSTTLIQTEDLARLCDATDALESGLYWLERWGAHVGDCQGGDACTCGLVAIRHELRLSLQPQN